MSKYMKLALELAENGMGQVLTNPLVGAVIVKDKRVISTGYHEKYGQYHAERNAILSCEEDLKGSHIYVNLEPCCHYGKTPPCTDLIIESGISEVTIGMEDPNPLVAGKGIEKLKKHGIKVNLGVLEKESKLLNRHFIKNIREKMPYVSLKTAMTLGGKIASKDLDTKWISNSKSRTIVQDMRNQHIGIMVGINTVINDNPRLTTRRENGNSIDPHRIIVDSTGKVPMNSRVIIEKSDKDTIILTTSKILDIKKEKLESMGVKVVICKDNSGRIDLQDAMEKLFEMGIGSILLEGGGTLNFEMARAGLIDEYFIFIAPKIIGGVNAPSIFSGDGISKINDSININIDDISMVGKDILIKGFKKGGLKCLLG